MVSGTDKWTTTTGGSYLYVVLDGDEWITGNFELHIDKTIAEVRGLGAIFSTTAAVATDVTVYNFDIANYDDDASSWYDEMALSWSGVESPTISNYLAPLSFLSSPITGANVHTHFTANNLRITNAQPSLTYAWDAGELMKTGWVYDKSVTSTNLNVNANWAGDNTSAAWSAGTGILLGTASSIVAFKIRQLQRFDITSYQEGKDLIDSLMTP